MPKKQNQDSLPRDKILVLYQRMTLDSKRHYQADIARDLECSPQTVSRLTHVIERHLGKDTYIERGLDGKRRFYRLVTKSHEKGLGFSFEELHFLALCRDLAAQYLQEPVVSRIDDTLTSLALMLGEQASPRPVIGFKSKGYIDYTPHLETIGQLRSAIAKRQVCQLSYTASGRDKPSLYRYAPGRVLVMGGTLYAQGYRLGDGSLLPGRPTTLSLHRISSIELTGEYFNFNAADGDARQFGLNWHDPKRVKVHVMPEAADYVRDRIWSDDQAIDEHADGSLTLAVTTSSEKELNAWVMSFGEFAQIKKS